MGPCIDSAPLRCRQRPGSRRLLGSNRRDAASQTPIGVRVGRGAGAGAPGRSARGALKSSARGWGAGRYKNSVALNFETSPIEKGSEPTPPESMAIQSPLNQRPRQLCEQNIKAYTTISLPARDSRACQPGLAGSLGRSSRGPPKCCNPGWVTGH